MALPRKDESERLNEAVANLNEEEKDIRTRRSDAVRSLTGHEEDGYRTVLDKHGVPRRIPITEKKKPLAVYMPESVFDRFQKLAQRQSVSRSSLVLQMILRYCKEHEDDDIDMLK